MRSLFANFVLAPLAILGLALFFDLPTPIAMGMMIMAAAPFAPMVPAFAGIAKGNLPVAAGHMVIYSVLAVVVTPTSSCGFSRSRKKSGARSTG